MRGYGHNSYGQGFADVYDDWYQGITDIDATVSTLVELAGRDSALAVLELGVGTGRLAVPLATRLASSPLAQPVVGIDSSGAMLDVLRSKPASPGVHIIVGDMVDDVPDGPFSVVFVAYNTFFGLLTAQRQQACFRRVADVLSPRGCFVVEAFVPDSPAREGNLVEVRSLAVDRVVLSVSVHDAVMQSAEGQFIEFSESGGVRLRPWSIRYASPEQLDAMAATAGLHLVSRWADFAQAPFTTESAHHVSVYSTLASVSAAG